MLTRATSAGSAPFGHRAQYQDRDHAGAECGHYSTDRGADRSGGGTIALTTNITEPCADDCAEESGEHHERVREDEGPAARSRSSVEGLGHPRMVTRAWHTGRMVSTQMTVAGAVVERDGHLLLVCNRRRNGAHDWSTPGGVVDPTDASVLAGLAREVEEETGLVVSSWEGPLYEVTAVALDMGWTMRCEVHRALEFDGELKIEDPDGIVVDASFVAPVDVEHHLAECFRWVRDPLAAWLAERWTAADQRTFRYEVRGRSLSSFEVVSVSTG